MTHFVLVHGSWHGAWCWADQIAVLNEYGHTATAVELPSDKVDVGASDYARLIAAAVRNPGQDVVVGHSMSGLALPLVPDHVEVSALVYLASLIPDPGVSWIEQSRVVPPMSGWFYEHALPHQQRDVEGRLRWPPDVAEELFFHDCPKDVARHAVTQLRPQSPTPMSESSPVAKFPEVPSYYLACEDDRTISPAWASSVVPARLGTVPVSIPGSHSPFLARPRFLADTIFDLLC
ncbi:alpha/beta hydrolase [Rhodococcus sp. ACS1]|uniref:alpha/beta fold hydrolase n=1 Tax=Rhodococcus sp. ACS1 TaxID=2028570 RepID=UPI000BB0FCAC|nr:alpha/beta hydrolase [Rhodococcus sp. ACS1]